MSTQSAPSDTARRTAVTAASSANVRPWSWKESGVRFTIAITATRREKSNSRRPMVRRGSSNSGTKAMIRQ
jgi:hypothetical protein